MGMLRVGMSPWMEGSAVRSDTACPGGLGHVTCPPCVTFQCHLPESPVRTASPELLGTHLQCQVGVTTTGHRRPLLAPGMTFPGPRTQMG